MIKSSTKTQITGNEELHTRILALVDEFGEASDIQIWQRSGPLYLPWQQLLKELKVLHVEGRLQYIMLAPGNWIVRSLGFIESQKSHSPKKKRLSDASPSHSANLTHQAKVSAKKQPNKARPLKTKGNKIALTDSTKSMSKSRSTRTTK